MATEYQMHIRLLLSKEVCAQFSELQEMAFPHNPNIPQLLLFASGLRMNMIK